MKRLSTLEDLLKQAEEAKKPPKEPIGGIPPQRLPSWIRYAIRLLVLPFIHLEALTNKIARALIRPPFKQIGRCKRRGNCCHYILIPKTQGIIHKIFSFWNTEVNGFYFRGLSYEHEGKKIDIYGCRYLRDDGSCSNYWFRPKICRTWPLIEHFDYPRVLKGCGFQVKVRASMEKKYPKLQILNED